MARLATCIPLSGGSPEDYLSVAKSIGADLTIAGPEAPLVAGVADLFHQHSLHLFGPSRAAARLEGSKIFAKRVMSAARIPTARYVEADTVDQALEALPRFEYPIVIKADGLAAGKGVILAGDLHEARAAIELLTTQFGPRLILEEFLEGEEASFIVLCDGRHALPLAPAQDHKRVFDGDQGPNTGGMGSYSDDRILDPNQIQEVMDLIIHPLLDYLASSGTPFLGFLYAGLMLTSAGPKVLEFNVRLGDPEAQSLLHRLRGGLLEAVTAAVRGSMQGYSLDWDSRPSVCVVLAAEGYPSAVRSGDTIEGIAAAEATGATVFHAGTRLVDARLVTAGGRVLGVTHTGGDLAAAIQNTYRAVSCIHFPGMHFRKDIGKKGLRRW